MNERPKFFDDLAGVAGGAMSALSGLRDEAESTIRARVEEVMRKLDLVRRDDLEPVQEMAAKARAAQEALEARVTALETRLAAAEAAAAPAPTLAPTPGPMVTPPPMVAPAMAPPVDTAEEPRPETPDLLAPKNAS